MKLCNVLFGVAFSLYQIYGELSEEKESSDLNVDGFSDNDKCSPEDLTESNEKILWKIDRPDGLTAAYPHCINDNQVYSLATCINGTFEHETCWTAQKQVSSCLSNDTEWAADDLCIQLTHPSFFDSKRCLPKHYKFDINIYTSISDDIWLPFQRDANYGIGEFVFTNIPSGSSIIFDGDYASRNWDHGCLATKNGGIVSSHCTTLKMSACVYYTLDSLKHHFCNHQNACKPSSYHQYFSTIQCFCSMRNCEEYAALHHPYQNKISFDRSPMLGIVNSNGLKWNSTQESLNYTYWGYDNLLDAVNFEEEFYVTQSKDGWGIQRLKPAYELCLKTFDFVRPNINIFLDLTNQVIHVSVENEQFIAANEEGDFIFCYTDAMPNHLYDLFITFKKGHSGDIEFVFDQTGYYWCEIYLVKYFERVVSEKVFGVNENVFSLEITFQYDVRLDPTGSNVAYKILISEFERVFRRESNILEATFKWIKTLSIQEPEVTYLVHLCLPWSFNSSHQYKLLSNALQNMYHYMLPAAYVYSNVSQNFVKSISELYHHAYCIETNASSDGVMLTWNTSRMGDFMIPNENCVDEFGKRIKRECAGDYYKGARWLSFTPCHAFSRTKSGWTDALYKITESDAEPIQSLSRISNSSIYFQPFDIFLVAKILDKTEHSSLKIIGQIIDDIMNADASVLQMSQVKYNATDIILAALDNLIRANGKSAVGNIMNFQNLKIINFDVNNSQICGFAIIGGSGGERFTKQLTEGTNLEYIYGIDDLEVAVYFPSTLMAILKKQESNFCSITFFLKNSLFNIDRADGSAISIGTSVLLPHIPEPSRYKIPVIFRPSENLKKRQRHCGYWKYGMANNHTGTGFWELERQPSTTGLKLLLCDYTHATHFNLIISNERKLEYVGAMEVISVIGLVVSTLGILGIIVTVIHFNGCFQNTGGNILVHYSIVTNVQIIVFFAQIMVQENYSKTACIFLGSCMLFTIIAQFSWMLVTAFFQYKRYVLVLQGPKLWIFEKASTLCYATPSVFVLILIVFYQDTYIEGDLGFCYPLGSANQYGLAVPISVIVATCIFLYCVTAWEVFCKTLDRVPESTLYLRFTLVLTTFLFLSISSVLGVLAQMFENIVIEIMYTAGVSFQGIFLFFVFLVCNGKVRSMYYYLWGTTTTFKP